MLTRQSIVEVFGVLVLSLAVLLWGLTSSSMGIWEPWEASIVLMARQIAHSSILETPFWLPQLDGEIAFRPYLQVWVMAACFHISPDPGAFLLRLPSALAGTWLIVLTFITVRQMSTRRGAWTTIVVLLTMPMFVFGSKLIQGGIWTILAVSLPILHYLLAAYAKTMHMRRSMQALAGISVLITFLTGGFFALIMVACVMLLASLCLSRHPQRRDFAAPLRTKYFLLPLYAAGLLIALCFGQTVTAMRHVLEERIPMPLSALNDAIEMNEVAAIERRGTAILGQLKAEDGKQPIPFILAETGFGLNTNAGEIFEHSESGRRTFEALLLRQFGKNAPPKARQEVPPLHGAVAVTFRYFMQHASQKPVQEKLSLARVSEAALSRNPNLANVYRSIPDERPQLITNIAPVTSIFEFSELQAGQVVQRLTPAPENTASQPFVEIRRGSLRGFVDNDALEDISQTPKWRWTTWLRVLAFGLFPWIAFFPLLILATLIPQRKLTLSQYPFRGEFLTPPNLDDQPNLRSPAQIILAVWSFISIITLWVGTNIANEYAFMGLLPMAILFGLVASSPQVWLCIRQRFLLRHGIWLASVAVIAFIAHVLYEAPFSLIQYLLVDPPMHWPPEYTLFAQTFWSFVPIFAVLSYLVFSPIGAALRHQIYCWFDGLYEKNKDEDNVRASSTYCKAGRPIDVALPSTTPAISLLLTALISSGFLYLVYLPAISGELTEDALISRYFAHANNGEKLFILKEETELPCITYRDCDPGYICKANHCTISTFSSYSLDFAQSMSRQLMLEYLKPIYGHEDAFFIIPKGSLFAINQAYRSAFYDNERRNVVVLNAPSSRLFLISNNESLMSVNPLNDVFIDTLPANATRFEAALHESLHIEGFRIESFTWQPKAQIRLTLFYRIQKPIFTDPQLRFIVNSPNRKMTTSHALLGGRYPARGFLEGDLVADPVTINLDIKPTHGIFDVQVMVVDGLHQNIPPVLLTSISF
ncbi:MAG: hypothetical protein FWC40_00325 [Proteobacteria bacterium]|nr:hypothetical protein [Pseudomonadota bacterium]